MGAQPSTSLKSQVEHLAGVITEATEQMHNAPDDPEKARDLQKKVQRATRELKRLFENERLTAEQKRFVLRILNKSLR